MLDTRRRAERAARAAAAWTRRTAASVTALVVALLIRLVRCGQVPRHVAFIMDGNRRFARRRALSSVSLGHTHGFKQLEHVLEGCLNLGVEMVSVYAFSIDNFARPRDEVAGLMALAEEKLHAFCASESIVRRHHVRVRVVGAVHLLPEQVQAAARHAEQLTLSHTGPSLNICMPYTSRHEMAVAALAAAAHKSACVGDFSDALLIPREPPLDLLVRTSGETRLSNFMLWQLTEPACHVEFLAKLWPDFGLFDMLWAIAKWQYRHLANLREVPAGC